MTKLTNVVVRTSKQQISVILRSQIMSGLKYLIKYESNRIYDTAAYQILISNAHSHERISGWESDQFAFRFEYGSRHGSVRVSYMNSDGLQSAIFSRDEWDCFTNFIRSDIDRQIEKQREENEREEEQRKQREFELAVREVVEKVIAEKKEVDQRYKPAKHVPNDILQKHFDKSTNPVDDLVDDDELY